LPGLREGVSREIFQQSLEHGDPAALLHRMPVQSGDSIFIPAGRIHAIMPAYSSWRFNRVRILPIACLIGTGWDSTANHVCCTSNKRWRGKLVGLCAGAYDGTSGKHGGEQQKPAGRLPLFRD